MYSYLNKFHIINIQIVLYENCLSSRVKNYREKERDSFKINYEKFIITLICFISCKQRERERERERERAFCFRFRILTGITQNGIFILNSSIYRDIKFLVNLKKCPEFALLSIFMVLFSYFIKSLVDQVIKFQKYLRHTEQLHSDNGVKII